MKKLPLEQGTPKWHEFRKKHIGSSDAPKIMNLCPYTTPYQLWRIRKGYDSEPVENDAMRRGKELEPFARWYVEEMLEIELFPVVAEHDSISWMGASFDAVSSDAKVIVEIKCPGKEDHLQALNNVVPEKYEYQIQHQLAVSELEFMYYFSYDGERGKLLKAYRDDTKIKLMIENEKVFWECLETETPPPLGNRDHKEINSPYWVQYSEEWKKINSQLKELEKKEKEVREYLIQVAGNQNCKGNGITLTKIMRKGNIEYMNVPELKNVDLEKYRKGNIETWRIS